MRDGAIASDDRADALPGGLHPRSAVDGIRWPGLPGTGDALALALLFQLAHSERWPAERIAALQLRQIEALIAHAMATVPFYRDRLRAAGVGGAALTLESFRRIPILTRAELQEAGPALLSRAVPKDHGAVGAAQSSGSTGRPVSVAITAVTRLVNQAINMRVHRWHGRDFRAKSGAIVAMASPAAAQAAAEGRPARWALGYLSGPMVQFDILRPLAEQLAWLAREEPRYLLTYPTNLRALLEMARAEGVRPKRLEQVATIAESGDADLPALCREVWGVPALDIYSARETGILAAQCGDGRPYHLHPEAAYVEILDEAGRPREAGETGRVVVTVLHNFAMPLIRYDIGDYAEAGGACPCGRALPTLARIVGRKRNMFVLPSGERFWPFAFKVGALNAIAPIRQIQLVQKTTRRIEVRLVAPRPLDGSQQARLRAHLASVIGHPFEFDIVPVAAIPRSAGGKYEDYISEVETEMQGSRR
jgi:phenylacetate-CoA ligase